ncbi:unnamed protein product [Rotaria magnacalcarata]|uniref:Uncharacterized protein n=2 Tax=Rotaria magnacalcarata TaxID=392030 RepID=A0A816SLK0_9BILA|nr:unnamed protein product [Rotaria magnacalcarata]CAF1675070.1 unnamed protein product [Rotaria magnacalcarata]CAF2082569.1 unnamed protein product [Rotaria magnacalcarata]CAF2139757.1 unnamed protein product [Rotaria magnacalcarata]CAF2193440.1 unnamed protein product [Rotaria magnacalcarata]
MAQSTSLQLVWLDANIHRDINREFWTKIREIYPEAMKFDDQDECLRFLGYGVDDPRRFILIVSGIIAEKLVPDIQRRENILSIYVYCANIFKHEEWSRQYEKVTVLTSAEEVLRGIKSDQKRFQ